MNRVGVKVTLTLNSKDTVFEILLFSRLKKFSGCFPLVFLINFQPDSSTPVIRN